MSDREKVKKYVETSSGKYIAPHGKWEKICIASASFNTQKEADIFVEELERFRVCCSPNMENLKMIHFHENTLAEVLAN